MLEQSIWVDDYETKPCSRIKQITTKAYLKNQEIIEQI